MTYRTTTFITTDGRLMIVCDELTFSLVLIDTGEIVPMDRESSRTAYDPLGVVRMFRNPMDDEHKELLSDMVNSHVDALIEKYFSTEDESVF